METLPIYLIVLVNIGILYFFFRSLPAASRFLFVMVVPVVFYFLNYPLRALIVLNSGQQNYSADAMYSSLLYGTLFTIIMLLFYRLRTNNQVSGYDCSKTDVSDKDMFLCHGTFGLVIAVFCFKVFTGRLAGLYDSTSALYSSFGVNFILMFDSIKWFCLTSSFIIYAKQKRPVFLFEGVTVSAIILFESFATTSKSTVVALLLFYLFFKSLNKSKINYAVICLCSCAIYLYMTVTYLVRYYGVVRGSLNLQTVIANYSNLADLFHYGSNQQLGIQGVAGRFNYLDGLAFTMQHAERLDKGVYSLGGIAELLNAIPRYFWPERDLFNFNMYLTRNIWGFGDLVSETPIGRIGESFFVLGYAGLLYAVVYGCLFAAIENRVFRNCSVTYLSMYFVVLYYYVWSDAHIVFYWKTILWTVLTVVCLGKLYEAVRLAKQSADTIGGVTCTLPEKRRI